MGGRDVPRWLNEGLATYACGELDTRQARFMVETAARTGRLLDLGVLEGLLGSSDARKDDPIGVEAAYFLAGSLMQHWIEKHGLDTVRATLLLMRDGSSIDGAVHKAVQTSLRDLVDQWRESL